MQIAGLDMLSRAGLEGRGTLWHRLVVKYGLRPKLLAVAALLIATSIAAVQIGADGFANMRNFVLDKALYSMTLETVHFEGLEKTKQQSLDQEIGMLTGSPMVDLPLNDIKTRIESLPWVKEAAVSRQYPNNLYISIIERTPFALWQVDGEVWLIDSAGVKITKDQLGAFSNYPFLVGEGAPQSFNEMADVLATGGQLASKVDALVRVGDRRWDVMFTTGARLRLPEASESYSIKQAWTRFALMNREHQLLSREVAVYDMRLPDRMIVTLTPRGEKVPLGSAKQT